MKKIFIIIIFLLSSNSYSEDIEKQYKSLIEELRCMVCQNQSIDESSAPLAKDMRILVRDKIKEGNTDKEIYDFLIARYGDFILLKPPFKIETFSCPIVLNVQ